MLIDAHCHLDDERLLPEVDSIVNAFSDDGLAAVVSASRDMASSRINLGLARKYDRVFATVGIHPQEASKLGQGDYDEIAAAAADDKVVAIGEIGLDYYYETSPRDVQAKVFVEQLEQAHGLKMPVVLHVRDAYEDFYKLITNNKKLLEYGGLLHCYSGSAEFMRRLKDFDFYYGFDGPVTYKNARHSIESLLAADINRIVAETDSPYLAPVPKRGATNYPAYVRFTAEKMAEVLGIGFDEISQILVNNTKRLFNIK